MKESNIKIFVSTFGKKIMNVDYSIPIEVGSSLRNDFNYALKDDTGDNISFENPYYAELTGMYWIWKNYQLDKDDLVGFCNYNKSLKLKRKDYEDLFKRSVDWITFEPIKIVAHSKIEEIDAVKRVLSTNFPEYYTSFNRLYGNDGSSKFENCRFANTFLTTRDEFYGYCSFLFPLLSLLRKEIGDLDVCANEKRYCAYIAERLLSVYLDANNKRVKSVGIRNKQWYLNYVSKLSSHLKVNKNGRLYKFLKSKFGYKSSYKNK